jgi:hypothetical protein|tara:strand:- start:322 stop:444 length:123 start_codon:yes stop_codon:yes gene_type:complete
MVSKPLGFSADIFDIAMQGLALILLRFRMTTKLTALGGEQ